MNRRANLYLNIFETISFLFFILFINLFFNYHNSLFLVLGTIYNLLFVAIEVFLFVLLKNNNKVIYIISLFIDLLLAIIINSRVTYSFYIVLIVFNIIKNIIRISLVKKIYMPREFSYYCKMFNIKIKDFKRKRKKKKTKTISIFSKIPMYKPKAKKAKSYT